MLYREMEIFIEDIIKYFGWNCFIIVEGMEKIWWELVEYFDVK